MNRIFPFYPIKCITTSVSVNSKKIKKTAISSIGTVSCALEKGSVTLIPGQNHGL